ncbi:unnamed protein product [Linum trigynum]|uniref:Uncharacterized protein n=1 Tax=Linum trigynum TaxID=586398 RepID=A0AAV2ESK0_9ROSI
MEANQRRSKREALGEGSEDPRRSNSILQKLMLMGYKKPRAPCRRRPCSTATKQGKREVELVGAICEESSLAETEDTFQISQEARMHPPLGRQYLNR